MLAATGISVWTYGAMLSVLWLISFALEGKIMIRTTFALLANWAAHIAYWYATKDPTPYFFSLGVDIATAVIILTRPAGRMQATIGWTLLAQIMIHFAYAFHILTGGYVAEAENRYWAMLDWIALCQIALVGGWWVGGMGRRLFSSTSHRSRTDRRDVVSALDHTGMV